MRTNVEFRKQFSDAAVLLSKFPHPRPCRVVIAFEKERVSDDMVHEGMILLDCYDVKSQDRLLSWLERGGEIDFIRWITAEGYSFTRMIGEAEHSNCLAIGFPKKRDRGFVVIEEPETINTDDVWDLLGQFKAPLRGPGMTKEYLTRCLINAPCLIVAFRDQLGSREIAT